jgi:neutral ceramidase
MSSRRLKKEVSSVLRTKVSEIVLSGLTNDFSGYITTPEEYMTQNYEGGHTLHGSQSLNALRQEYHSMSLVLKEGTKNTKTVTTLQPLDLSDRVSSLPIPFANEVSKEPKKVIQPNANVYRLGEEVNCRVESANPNVGFRTVTSYVWVEKLDGSTWNSVRSDSDYDTKFIFQKSKLWGITEANLELIWETNSS